MAGSKDSGEQGLGEKEDEKKKRPSKNFQPFSPLLSPRCDVYKKSSLYVIGRGAGRVLSYGVLGYSVLLVHSVADAGPPCLALI